MTILPTLALILALLGAPPIPGAETVTVEYRDEMRWAYGTVCDDRFLHVEGNMHAYFCDGTPDRTIVIYAGATKSDALLLNILAHEFFHLDNDINHDGHTAYERLREAEAYTYGCRYSWVEDFCIGHGVKR
jgi:hypothetical protein